MGMHEFQNQLDVLTTAIKRGNYDALDLAYPSVSQALTSAVRPSISAPKGKLLCVADLSSIETVVIGWMSQCPRILDLFRNGLDAYKDFAVEVFGVDYDDVTKAQRKFSKPPVLGCGFGLGAFGLRAYATGFHVNLAELYTREDFNLLVEMGECSAEAEDLVQMRPDYQSLAVSQRLVNTYRQSYRQVPDWWKLLQSAAFTAVTDKRSCSAGSVEYIYEEPYLFCRLPSGRHLTYVEPELQWLEHPKFGKVLNLTYMGQNQKTRKWERISTHRGKLAENCVQAVARDFLAEGLKNADAAGFEVVGHVHDEILTLIDATVNEDTRQTKLDELIACMTTLPSWARQIPLGAAGWVGQRYCKD